MSSDKTHDSIEFSCAFRMSRQQMEQDKDWAKHFCERRLHEQMAAYIVDKLTEVVVHPDYYEQRLDLYVATPSEFWAIVRAEADKIARIMPHG